MEKVLDVLKRSIGIALCEGFLVGSDRFFSGFCDILGSFGGEKLWGKERVDPTMLPRAAAAADADIENLSPVSFQKHAPLVGILEREKHTQISKLHRHEKSHTPSIHMGAYAVSENHVSERIEKMPIRIDFKTIPVCMGHYGATVLIRTQIVGIKNPPLAVMAEERKRKRINERSGEELLVVERIVYPPPKSLSREDIMRREIVGGGYRTVHGGLLLGGSGDRHDFWREGRPRGADTVCILRESILDIGDMLFLLSVFFHEIP